MWLISTMDSWHLPLPQAPFDCPHCGSVRLCGFFCHKYVWIRLGFLESDPPMRIETLSALPLDIGLYPVLGCWYIILVQRYRRSAILTLTFALGTTLLEGFGVAVGHASYGNGWNLGWTFVSYFVAYLGVNRFYRCMWHVIANYKQWN